MRIALIGNDMYPQFPLRGYGGIESSVETLAWGLHQAGQDFFCVVPGTVVAGKTATYPFEVLRTKAQATIHARGTPEAFINEARDLLRAAQPDVVWAQSVWSARVLSSLGVPVIVTIQDSGSGDARQLVHHPLIAYRFISHFQYREWVRDEETRAFVAYTSLADEDYAFHPVGGDAFLWVGGLGWGFEGKGLDTFLELARRNPKDRFVAYASGRRSLRLRAHWAGVTVRNFTFKGELLRGSAHRAAFANARAFIMPTRLKEALGRTVLESLSKGTPVIGSANGALPELIDGSNGIATNDIDAMQEALHTAFDRQRCFSSAQRFHVRFEVDRLVQVSERLLRGDSIESSASGREGREAPL